MSGRWGRGELHAPGGGLGPCRAACPGVGTYDADPGHEEQHDSQGQAHTVVAHGVEDGAEFLLAYASEHPAAGSLPGRGAGVRAGTTALAGFGTLELPGHWGTSLVVDQLPASAHLFLCLCPVLWVIIFLRTRCFLRGGPRSSAGSWCRCSLKARRTLDRPTCNAAAQHQGSPTKNSSISRDLHTWLQTSGRQRRQA